MASRGAEAMIEPAPFFEESVRWSLVTRSLKWRAAAMISENMVFASLFEEKCAVSSTWTFVMVAG